MGEKFFPAGLKNVRSFGGPTSLPHEYVLEMNTFSMAPVEEWERTQASMIVSDIWAIIEMQDTGPYLFRHGFIAGLSGEDGVTIVSTWLREQEYETAVKLLTARKILTDKSIEINSPKSNMRRFQRLLL